MCQFIRPIRKCFHSSSKIQRKTRPAEDSVNMNQFFYLENNKLRFQSVKLFSPNLEDSSKIDSCVACCTMLTQILLLFYICQYCDHMEGANIDLLTDTDPWSNLKVCHISISKCILPII